MNNKIIQLIFLLIAGFIVGWREWTKPVTNISENYIARVNEVGSSNEAAIVFLIFLFGAIAALVVNRWWQATLNLSSPNSV